MTSETKPKSKMYLPWGSHERQHRWKETSVLGTWSDERRRGGWNKSEPIGGKIKE